MTDQRPTIPVRVANACKWPALLAAGCAAAVLLYGGFAALIANDNTDTARYEAQQQEAAERRERDTGIRCNADDDNTSGNVCKVTLGDRECVAILPDDESGNSLADKSQLVECDR